MLKHTLTYLLLLIVLTINAQLAITIPAEYEKNDKLLMVWPYEAAIDSIVGEITSLAVQTAHVELIFNPDSIQFDTTQIRNFLANIGISNENVDLIPAHTNTYWLRQYAPITGYGVFADNLVLYFGNPGFSAYNRPDDDSIPSQLANYMNKDLANYNLNFENINIQYDGLRNLFVGDRILDQNLPMDENEIRFALNSYFNSDEVFIIPSLDQSGGGIWQSTDTYMKFLDFETIAISSIPDTLPDYNNLEDIVAELSSINDYFGYNYNIVRIPSPPNENGQYPISQDEELRSYTNSLILNDLVIVPSFGLPEYDSTAYYTYKKFLPGYNIKLVDARLLTPNHGSLHTLTKEIPQENFLRIIHSKIIGSQAYMPDYQINCLAGAGDLVEEMWLYHKRNSDTAYTKTSIHLVCPQHFAKIENLLPTDTVHYYIEAVSSSTTTTYPLSAPNGNFTFWFDIVEIEENAMVEHKFNIAPNPTTGDFRVISNDSYGKILVSIFNSVGQLVQEKISSTGKLIQTEGKLKTGYYTVVIENNNNSSKFKLVVLN